MADDNKLYWIWLAELFGQGSVTASRLIQKYKDPRIIYENQGSDLEKDDFFNDKRIEDIKSRLQNNSLEKAKDIIAQCEKSKIFLLTPDMAEYPAKLKTIRDFPLVLYYKGKMPNCSGYFMTTIVGTRSMTDYGRRIAYTLAAGIVFGGGIIVSGMALGSDSMALIGALEAGGKVIAVLGSGVDVIYPREHKELYYKIINNGAVISEYPPGTPPAGKNFPVRNRIMSGLSDASVVVEADMKSGSLITARYCLEQGRKLFAVPGKVGERGAEGPNSLIREGALPVITPEDVICEFEHDYRRTLSLDRAHAMLRNIDFENLSQDAMSRTRIGVSGGSRNYYGMGSYGGRIRDYEAAHSKEQPAYNRNINEDNRPKESKQEKDNINKDKKTEPVSFKKIITSSSDIVSSFLTKKKENNNTKKQEQIVNSEKNFIPAKKIELDMLDENEIKVYNRMKPNVPVLPDELADENLNVADIMSALTILEMAGAVESGGGGYYMRTSPDDIMQSQND